MTSQLDIINHLKEGVIIAELTGKILEINKVAANIASNEPKELIGADLKNSGFDKQIVNFFQSVSSTLLPQESDIALVEGRDRSYRIYGTIITAKAKKDSVLLVLTDVTALKRLEKVRRDFVANVSHELRTPIASIRGSAETLLDGALQKPEDAKMFTQMIERQSVRLSTIVEDLLTLSRLEGESRSELPTFPSDILELIKEAAELCKVRAKEKDIQIIITAKQSVSILVNANLLRQAFVNVIDNGIKASKQKGEITVELNKISDAVQIKITDQGIGINKEHLPRIFERFYTADKSRSTGGTGLGLAIVKHILRAHGGKITVESAEGVGSVFTLLLPI